ncbi:MAG: MFS transporter [Actinomycetota bacterium]|nr:MFS transporter [Actinomycetota bacterium]
MNALQVPAFRRLALAWAFSNFGDSALYLTLAVWVKDLTGSDASAGLVFLFLGLPVLLAPVAGQLADRGSRRRLVVLANLAGAAVVLTLGFVDGRNDVWIIYVVTFLYGLITYLTSAAGAGLVRDLLADDQLASGNGLLSTIDQGLRLVSPLVGVGAYALFGGFAIAWVASLMLVAAAVVTATVRVVESPPAPREPFWPEITAGVRHIRSVPVLARVTVAMAVAVGITGLANTVIFALIDEGLHRSSDFFGVFAAFQGGGAVVGGLTAAAVITRFEERAVIAGGMVAMAAGLAAAAVADVVVVCIAAWVVGWMVSWIFVAFSTLRQRVTPAQLQGRVQAAVNVALNGPQAVGTALGAVLVAVVDYRILIVGMAVVIAGCAVPVAARAAPASGEVPRGTVRHV